MVEFCVVLLVPGTWSCFSVGGVQEEAVEGEGTFALGWSTRLSENKHHNKNNAIKPSLCKEKNYYVYVHVHCRSKEYSYGS